MAEDFERIIEDLSPYLSSQLNSLGDLGSGVDKEDLLQEIRLRIWKACRTRGDDIHYFNAYIKKIVLSVFINEFKKLKKERNLLQCVEVRANLEEEPGGGDSLPDGRFRTALMESLGALRETKRRVIMLRLEGFSYADIAQLNKWTYRKTCNIFYRGIKELKNRLREEGVYYED